MIKDRSILLQSEIFEDTSQPSSVKNFNARKNFATFGEVHSTKNAARMRQPSEGTTPYYNTGTYFKKEDYNSTSYRSGERHRRTTSEHQYKVPRPPMKVTSDTKHK